MVIGIAASAILVLIIARRFWRPDPFWEGVVIDLPSTREVILGLALLAASLYCLIESVRERSDVELIFSTFFFAFGITSLLSGSFHALTREQQIGWRADLVLLTSIVGVGALVRVLAHQFGGLFGILSAFGPLVVFLIWARWQAASRRRERTP